MTNYWFISDTHFNHERMLEFKNEDGTSCRDFSSVEEMNETIIENWNKLIKPHDKVYHLGDVILGNRKEFDKILKRLNGKKRLTLGNHDWDKVEYLQKYFEDISGVRKMRIKGKKFVVTHAPLHTYCLERFKFNIHGHIHEKSIILDTSKYLNVSVERTNYKPINLDELDNI